MEHTVIKKRFEEKTGDALYSQYMVDAKTRDDIEAVMDYLKQNTSFDVSKEPIFDDTLRRPFWFYITITFKNEQEVEEFEAMFDDMVEEVFYSESYFD